MAQMLQDCAKLRQFPRGAETNSNSLAPILKKIQSGRLGSNSIKLQK